MSMSSTSINPTSDTPQTPEPTILNLDHLGLPCGMMDELGLVELIDQLLPSDKTRTLSHGEAVKAMLLNGLGYVNQRLYLTPYFFADKPLKRLFGREIEPHQINDAVLGKTLD